MVVGILRENLPAGTKIWVFGSRATGRARRYSDLDLLLDAGRPLTLDEAAVLAEAFEESDLPYCVDIVDWHAIGDRFREIIATQRLPLVPAVSQTQPIQDAAGPAAVPSAASSDRFKS